MPDRVISVPQATQIATRIKNKFDNVNGRLAQVQSAVIRTVPSTDMVTWEQGNLKPNDGTLNSSTVNVRTTGYVPVDVLRISVTDPDYIIRIYGYNEADDSYAGMWMGTEFKPYSSSYTINYSEFDMANAIGYRVKIVLRKADGTDITVSAVTNVTCDLPIINVSEIETEIENINERIYAEVESPELMLWSQGNFNANTGGEASSTTFIRTGYVDPSILSVRLTDANYQMTIYAFAQDDTYIGIWMGTAFKPYSSSYTIKYDSFDMSNAGEYKIRIRVGKTNASDILPSEASVMLCKIMAFDVDDSTPTEYPGHEISVFDNILCIGDSLIAGGGNQPAGISPDQSKASRTVVGAMYSIPTQLKKMYGMETTNWGISGATTESWYNSNVASHPSWSGHDAALIYIGSNDYNYVTTQGMTIEDGAEKSYTYLKNIISKLKTDNVGIRIFLCTLNPGSTKGTYAQYRIPLIAKMRQIANEEPSVFLIDMNTYGTLETYSPYHNGHPTPIGYNLMAREMGSYISWTINNKPQSFKWIRWIGTEYAVGDNDVPTGDLPDVG